MKRLKMLTNYAGPDQCVNSGEEGNFSDKEAAGLINAGYAVEAEKPGPEKAVAEKGEKAVKGAGAGKLAEAAAKAEKKAARLEEAADKAEKLATEAKGGARKGVAKKAKAARKAADAARKKADELKAAAAKE